MIPILSEKVSPTTHKTVEWVLHNVCNYDCSFCGSEHKRGDIRWKNIDTYKLYVDKLISATGPNPWFLFNGGEPTLYPDFIELLTYLKYKGAYTILTTNGSRTMRWWKECRDANIIDSLYLSYHTETTSDYKHVADVLNLFHNTPTKTTCFITHTEKTIDLVTEATEYLVENTASKIEIKYINLPTEYSFYGSIPESFLEFSKKTHVGKKPNKIESNIPISNQYENQIKITYDNNTNEIFRGAQDLVKQGKNRFRGWMCNVNNNVLTLEGSLCRYGQMDCRLSGIIADLDVEDVKFVDNYTECIYESCHCSGNLYSKKYKKT
jgi:organic radical activating enzyme